MQGDFNRNLLTAPRQRTYAQPQASPASGLVARGGTLPSGGMAEMLEAVAAHLRAGAVIDRPINVRIRIGVIRCYEMDPRMIDALGWPPAQDGANWPVWDGDEIVQ